MGYSTLLKKGIWECVLILLGPFGSMRQASDKPSACRPVAMHTARSSLLESLTAEEVTSHVLAWKRALQWLLLPTSIVQYRAFRCRVVASSACAWKLHVAVSATPPVREISHNQTLPKSLPRQIQNR